jgi:PAS domain S-box-containing protein
MATMDGERGKRLRSIRKHLGDKQALFGERFGITGSAVSLYEKGRLPEDEILKELYKLGYSIDWLISGEGHMRLDEDWSEQTEELFKAALNHFEDGVTIFQDGEHKFANKSLQRIMGYTPEDFTGGNFDAHAVPEEKERLKRVYKRFMAGEELPEQDVLTIRSKDGAIKDVKVNYTSIQYGGKPAILGIVRDSQSGQTRRSLDDIDSSLTREERMFVRVFKALMKEMVKVD